jgi:hypothetical protein
MISTVQTPLPILAQVAPKICAHFCAPSPELVMISTVCSGTSFTWMSLLAAVSTLAHSVSDRPIAAIGGVRPDQLYIYGVANKLA